MSQNETAERAREEDVLVEMAQKVGGSGKTLQIIPWTSSYTMSSTA